MLTAMYPSSINTATLIDANSSCRVRVPGNSLTTDWVSTIGGTGSSGFGSGAEIVAAAVCFFAAVKMTGGLSTLLGTIFLSLAICCE